MQSWNEMSRKDQLAAIHYDLYKDVNGVRPRWYNYDEMSELDLERELDSLEEQLKVNMELEKRAQEVSIKAFEKHVVDTMCMGAKDRETALRWIMDASDACGDWEYFCFQNGLPYGYFNKAA